VGSIDPAANGELSGHFGIPKFNGSSKTKKR